MTEPLVLIPDVKDGKKDWAVKVTITEEMPTLIRYKRGTRYILTGDEGNTILAIAYDSVISAFSNILHLHGVYVISNASIKLPTGTSTSQVNTFHGVLQHGRALRHGNLSIDIMAILISFEIAKFVTTDYGESPVQRFAIVDAR
ncbi:hypothetical protein LIER_14609 [Lithospermum erythrorhizon]|uniref:Uncharacterized protein n=1 Tax=Lithospermum erythrorhizon TaxID=34254 RepID=A0AAV3Q0R8_LITER